MQYPRRWGKGWAGEGPRPSVRIDKEKSTIPSFFLLCSCPFCQNYTCRLFPVFRHSSQSSAVNLRPHRPPARDFGLSLSASRLLSVVFYEAALAFPCCSYPSRVHVLAPPYVFRSTGPRLRMRRDGRSPESTYNPFAPNAFLADFWIVRCRR